MGKYDIQKLVRIIEAAEAEAKRAAEEARDVDLSEFGDKAEPYDPAFHLTSRNGEVQAIFGTQCDLLEIDVVDLEPEDVEAILTAGWYWYGDDGHSGDNADAPLEGYPLESQELACQLEDEIESWQDASRWNWMEIRQAEEEAEQYQEYLQRGHDAE